MSHFVTVDDLVGGALFGATSLFLPGYSTAQRVVVPATGATVFVYLRGTTTPVSVYADQHGAGSPSAQPLTTDIDGHVIDSGGHVVFVAQPVELDIVVSGGGLAAPKTLPGGAAPEAGGGGGGASGTVTQINGVNPDGSGHVTLTPAAIAADSAGAATSAQSAAQAYTDLKVALLAPKASPAFTGTPTAPTPPAGTNSTVLATTAFVQAAVGGGRPPSSTSVPNGWFDVTAYGAVGNGTTDDTAAFQAAINAASVGAASGYAPGGGTVYVPPSAHAYIISNLTYNVSGLKFRGGGAANSCVLSQKPGSSGAMLKPATIDASTQFLYLTFEDLCFTGTTNTGGSNTVGVDLTSTRLCSFERCHFEWFTSCGILIQCGPNGGNGANDSIAHTIHACFFNNNVGSAPGVWFRTNPSDLHASGQGYSQIDSCFFNGNGNDNVGIMGPTAKTKITNNHFMAVVWPLIGVFQQCVFSQNSAENFAYGSSSWTGAGGVGFNLPANGPGFGTLTGQQNYMVLMAFNHYAVPNVGTKGVNIITAPGFGGLQRVFDHDGYGVFAYHTELTAGGGTSYGVGDSIVPPF